MTINATMPPTVDEFREAFPEFDAVSDEQVQLYLDIGVSWVDLSFWNQQDAKVASMFAAAHYLWLHDMASGGTLSSSGETGGGSGTTPVDPEVGKIWVKSVRFRDRLVTYERVGMGAQSDTSGGGQKQANAEQFWESSPYGPIYESLRRRNVPHIAVI
jgi:Protein of unknown function (DUF4054)